MCNTWLQISTHLRHSRWPQWNRASSGRLKSVSLHQTITKLTGSTLNPGPDRYQLLTTSNVSKLEELDVRSIGRKGVEKVCLCTSAQHHHTLLVLSKPSRLPRHARNSEETILRPSPPRRTTSPATRLNSRYAMASVGIMESRAPYYLRDVATIMMAFSCNLFRSLEGGNGRKHRLRTDQVFSVYNGCIFHLLFSILLRKSLPLSSPPLLQL